MKKILILVAALSLATAALAKLPAPSEEAKAKAAEAAAKTAWNGKVEGWLLCKSQDKVAAAYFKTAKATGKETKPAAETPACADPGPFAYTPAVPATAAPATAPTAAAAPAAAMPAVPAASAKKS